MGTTAPPAILVHASFPRSLELGADLNLNTSNWRWVHCLTLPLDTLNRLQFSQRPYKWIRYATGVVVGAQGDFSFSPDSPNTVDYNAGLPTQSAVLYYHTTEEERRRMFPVDPNMGRSHITSSVATTRRGDFRDDVAERDGGFCVLSGASERICDAVHLLAHSKGDMYIETYTQRRSRDPTGADIIHEIDNVRNGLFLNKYTHPSLGEDVAFLKTPNFAMDTNDIIPTAEPTEKRFTAHLFDPDDPDALGACRAHPGSALRISDNGDSPPTILFDAVYAGAVLHHFGTQTLKDELAATWKDTFYPVTTAHVDHKDDRAAAAQRKQKHARKPRYEARSGPDLLDMLDMMPYILIPPKELKATFEEAGGRQKRRSRNTHRRKLTLGWRHPFRTHRNPGQSTKSVFYLPWRSATAKLASDDALVSMALILIGAPSGACSEIKNRSKMYSSTLMLVYFIEERGLSDLQK